MYYAFLMACKYPILQHFVEAVLDCNTRFSGNVLLPDGTPLSNSFLDTQPPGGKPENTQSSSGDGGAAGWSQPTNTASESSAHSGVSSGWKRKVEKACDDFRVFVRSPPHSASTGSAPGDPRGSADSALWRPPPEHRTLGDNIALMKNLQEQFMGLLGFLNRMNVEDDNRWFIQEEVSAVQDRMTALRKEMQQQQRMNEHVARSGVAEGPPATRLHMDPQ
mmetsp:Transcript_33372/g.68916  ORF Transcript_33372/g.68916 Transcript_33372/m.68916 type:complete len:220 (-) Transcript_33372:203-862(-)